MPYNINRYSGTLVTTVEDGTVDNTLDIKLIGRNYAGYGEVQNENMVHLLENFASVSEPPRKISGQIWYDSKNKKLKFYDGIKFRTTGGAEIGATEPTNLTVGDFWFNTNTNQLYAWAGELKGFVLVGPQSVQTQQGSTEFKTVLVQDIGGNSYPIIKAQINNKTVMIISSNEFTLPTGAIEGFKLIKKGTTLVDTMETNPDNPAYGITSTEYRFWGTTSNSLRLNGKKDTDFVLVDNPQFTGTVGFSNDGLTVGLLDTLEVKINNDGNPTVNCIKVDGTINFLTKTSSITDPIKTAMKLQGSDILPGVHTQSSLGRSDLKFKDVYSLNFYGALKGTADKADLLNVDGTYIEGSLNAEPNTVAARDSNGFITANKFIGPADRALAISGGAPGSIPYQTAANATSFIAKGNSNDVLSINAQNQITWLPITSLVNASNADKIKPVTANLVNATHFISFVSGSTGYQDLNIDATGLTYNPNTNTLTTGFINGQAQSASYADLAEKFLADKNYDVGTVLVVGGEKEVTASGFSQRAIGVVSDKPAYVMNNDLEDGTIVALKGRVPVKVFGTVKKGDKLVAHDDGTAVHSYSSVDVFAIALENNDEPGVKLVECVIL